MESTNPIGIFLFGGPGCGKDYVLSNIFSRFDLTEVDVDQVINGTANELVEQKKNIVINGAIDAQKMAIVSSILEGYTIDNVFVSVTNKVSRLRNSLRENPLNENRRIEKLLAADKIAESLDDKFVFNNSINLKESTDMERVFFGSQIENLLARLVEHGLVMQEKPTPKTFSQIKEQIQRPKVPAMRYVPSESERVRESKKKAREHRVRHRWLDHKNDDSRRLAAEQVKPKEAIKLGAAAAKLKIHSVGDTGTPVQEKKEFPDVRHHESGLPSKYVAGLTPSEIKAKKAHIKKNERLSDKDPEAYKDMPGDKRVRKKGMPLSKYTKAYHKEFGEEVELMDEGKADSSLAAKAKKSGVSLSTLRKVYNRGVAAWNSGHRPGTTPAQWGHARVNSYIMKGKTYHTADKDLREEIDTLFERQFDGTDSYRKHAIEMTPGQSQEITDAQGNTQDVSTDQEQCGCGGGCDCNSVGDIPTGASGDGSYSRSAGKIKEEKQDQQQDGVNFNPVISTKKKTGKQTRPFNTLDSTLQGMPTVSTAFAEQTSLEEAVRYHTENKISFTENVFRPGSDMFFQLIGEAKRLYKEGLYEPADEYEADLLESDIGEKVVYEGKEVYLDFPFEEDGEDLQEEDKTDGKGIGKPFRSNGGGAVYVRTGSGGVKKVNFSQSGMKKRFMEPGRLKSFMARHHCLTNKDKTSASYWACRWPRYFSNTGKKWW